MRESHTVPSVDMTVPMMKMKMMTGNDIKFL